MYMQLSTTSPRDTLDAYIDNATSQQIEEIITMIGKYDAEANNELFSAIVALRDVAAGAGFRAGWAAHADPAPWLLGDNSGE